MSATSDAIAGLPPGPGAGVAESMLDALRHIAEAVHSGADVDAIMQGLVQAVVTHGPWPQAWVGLFNETHSEMLRSYEAGFSAESVSEFYDWPLADSPSRMAIRTGKPVEIPDVTTWQAYPHVQVAGPRVGYMSSLYMPIPVEGLWVVMTVHRRRAHAFGAAEQSLTRIIASFAALAFRNVIMRDEAVETERQTNVELSRLNAVVLSQNEELHRLEAVHERLLDVQLAGTGLAQLCTTLAGLLDAPVVLLDRFHQVGHVAGMPVDTATDIVAGLSSADAGRRAGAGGVAVVELADRRLVVGRARDAESRVATVVVVWPERAFTDADARVVQLGSLHVALEILKQRAALEAETRLQQDFTAALLSGSADLPELARRAAILGLRLDAPNRVLRAHVHGLDDGLAQADATELGRLLQRRLGAGRPNCLVAPVGDRDVAVVLPGPDPDGAAAAQACAVVRRTLREGIAALRGIRVSAVQVAIGLGSTGVGAQALGRSHAEALRALDVIAAVGPHDRDLDITSAGSYALLTATTGHDREAFVRRYLEPLTRYDELHGSNLIATLRTYFEAVGNVQRTAELMYLHISTARYRLGRIEEIAAVSLRDAEDRLCLQMALRLAGMAGRPADAGRP